MNTDITDSAMDDITEEVRTASGENEQQLSILFGTYADIIFILLPFFVIAIFKLWQSDMKSILSSYDLSMAAAILGGLSIVKFIMGLMIDPKMLQHKERIVFLIAATIFLVLVPGLLFSVLVMMADPVPPFALFVQPLLLVLGVIAYSGSVISTNALLHKSKR